MFFANRRQQKRAKKILPAGRIFLNAYSIDLITVIHGQPARRVGQARAVQLFLQALQSLVGLFYFSIYSAKLLFYFFINLLVSFRMHGCGAV
jgi:hypothetical protein